MNSSDCNTQKKDAIVFVDYENWFYTLANSENKTDAILEKKPNIEALIDEISQESKIKEIYFFADFTHEQISKERSRIQAFSSDIIDCANPEGTKEFTDFIIVDKIYRTVFERKDIERYILVSSDAHFQQVVASTKNILRKEFFVYGIDIAKRLKNSASKYKEIHTHTINDPLRYEVMLVESIKKCEPPFYPTFRKTVESCSRYNNVEESLVNEILKNMIQKGQVIQREIEIKNEGQEETQKIRALLLP